MSQWAGLWPVRGRLGPVCYPKGDPPQAQLPSVEWVQVAIESAQFTLSESTPVRYGKEPTWVALTLGAGTYTCNNATFGDPLPGILKECQVPVGSSPPPPPPPTGGVPPLEYPAAFHIFGGNSQAAFGVCDVVVSSSFGEGNPSVEKNGGNPTLIAVAHGAWDPYNPDFTLRKGHAFTYGSGLSAWPGGTDNLSPSPLGTVRAFNPATDNGCVQSDGLQGFHLDVVDTADMIKRLLWYEWKLRNLSDAWDGLWSDNLVPGNLIKAGWFYGSSCPIVNAEWDVGFQSICNGLRALGVPLVGGNVAYRANTTAVRASANIALDEVLESGITSASAFASRLADVEAWLGAAPAPRIMNMMHLVPQSDTAGMRKGLALACIAKASYMPYQTHASLYQPVEMTPRRRFGSAIGNHTRVGNTFSQQFANGVVSYNFDTGVASFPS